MALDRHRLWKLSAVVALFAGVTAVAWQPENPLKEVKQRQAIADQKQTTVVTEAITEAARLAPTEARTLLKRTLDGVRTNPDVSEKTRMAMVQRLEAFLATGRDPGGASSEVADVVKLPTDPTLRHKLDAARDYLKVGDSGQAVKLLQAVLDAREDALYRQQFTDPSGKPAERLVSVRAEADRMMAALPEDARKIHEALFNGSAVRMLGDAANDVTALEELVRRFSHTSAGVEGLTLLGSLHLDRGRFDLAAVCFDQLLRQSNSDKLPPLSLFKAALAFRGTGDPAREEQAWNALSRRVGMAGLKLGVKEYPIDQLKRHVTLPVTDRDRAVDWPLFRGTATRTGRGEGDVPLLDSRARVPAADEAVLDWHRAARPTGGEVVKRIVTDMGEIILERSARPTGPAALMPVGVPIASGNRLVFRGAGGVRAVDAISGKEVWRADPGLSLAGVLGEPGKKVQVEDWLSKYRAAGQQMVLTQNSVLGTLSTDGRNVYVVEDLPLPPPPQMIVEMQSGVPRYFGPLRNLIHHNRLRALDLTDGHVAWEIGGRARFAPPELADAYFLGPPLPVGGSLYVLVDRQSDLRLLCLSPDNGTVLWAQTLATARTRMLLDVPRRLHAIHLAYRDGVLVCPTNAGAILGVDLLSRSLLWAHPYRDRPPSMPPGEEIQPGMIPPETFTTGFRHTAPILAGDRIVYASPEGGGVRCLSLRDGSLLWKAASEEDDLYVGGVQDGRVLIVGRSTCRTLSLDKGVQLWRQAIEEPAGLGALCGKRYYIPMRDTGVLVIDLANPDRHIRLDCRKGEAKGNLVFHAGDLWSQDDGGVTAYPQLAAKLARIEEVLKRTPDDLAVRIERGQLMLDKGELAAAVGDFKRVLAVTQSAEQTARTKTLLFAALTRLLQQDFAAGEKYLDEYHDLCRVSIPNDAGPDVRLRLQAEGRRRQAGYFALLARGRQKQGRPTDALHAYRDLYDATVGGAPLALPDDPAVHVRPDLWVRSRVAELLSRATPAQRTALLAEIEREAKTLPDDLAAMTRFAALFGGIPGPEGDAGREVRLRLAERMAEGEDHKQALAGLLELQALEVLGASVPGLFQARALEARARILTMRGMLPDAVECYRRLAREYPDVRLPSGRTGAALLAGLREDKRFLASLETVVPAWQGKLLGPETVKGRYPGPGLAISDGFETFISGNAYEAGLIARTVEPTTTIRNFRFVIDTEALRLRVLQRLPEVELWSVPLPFGGSGVRDAATTPGRQPVTFSYWRVGEVVVVCTGPLVFAADLVERKVCWAYNVAADSQGKIGPSFSATSGVMMTNLSGQESFLGMCCAPDLNGVYLQTTGGLVALDPATGAVRWRRSDMPMSFTAFLDGSFLFLAEYLKNGNNLRGVRAIRTDDGVSLPIPAQELAIEYFTKHRTIVGHCLLLAENGMRTPLNLSIYDLLKGEVIWRHDLPVGSVVAESVDPRLTAFITPTGDVTVFDLVARRKAVRAKIAPQDIGGVFTATLLSDRDNFYLAIQNPSLPETDGVAESLFECELSSVPVNGALYCFSRETGKVRWRDRSLNFQTILLDRFDELPVVLCASTLQKSQPNGMPVTIQRIRSIDKLTGKVRIDREGPKLTAPFHTLRLDPLAGTIDLISEDTRLRHQVGP